MELKNYASKFCAVAWKTPDDTFSLLCVYSKEKSHRKVVVFDSFPHAQDFISTLACERYSSWSQDGETCCFTPISKNGVNLACIVKDYDPYNLPANNPVGSEAHGIEWKNHITNWEAFYDIGGNFKTEDDGTITNLAIG